MKTCSTHLSQTLKALKEAGPYIKSQRGNIIVIALPELTSKQDELYLNSILNDIAILHTLGLKILITFDAASPEHIDAHTLNTLSLSIGMMRHKIEGILSQASLATSTNKTFISVCSGNFIVAKPKGIINGFDAGFLGNIRKINTDAILNILHSDAIALIPPLGYCASGEVFILSSLEIANKIACAISASKLIYLTSCDDNLPRELTPEQGIELSVGSSIESSEKSSSSNLTLLNAAQACKNGVKRCYLLDHTMEGALVLELLTRDGVGTMLTSEGYDELRGARIDDIPGMIALIEPMVQADILVKRNQERLEQEINYFHIMLRDGLIIGCGAIYPYADEHMAEIACLAMHPDYRDNGRALKILNALEKESKKQGFNKIFALTTHTAHWFLEHGFAKAALESLPIKKQELYNYQRNSLVFVKSIN